MLRNYLQKTEAAFVITAIFAVLGFALFFIELYSSGYVTADNWRHIDLYLRDWIYNSFSFKNLYADYHQFPIGALSLILSYELFDLNMKVDAYLGYFVRFIGSVMSCYCLSRLMSGGNRKNLIVYLLPFCCLFTFQSHQVYHWPLLLFNNSFALFTILCVVLVFDRYLQGDKLLTLQNSTFFILLFALLIFSHGDPNRILLAILLITFLFLSVYEKDRRVMGVFVVAVLLCLVFFYYCSYFPIRGPKKDPLKVIALLDNGVLPLLKSYLSVVSFTFINPSILSSLFGKSKDIYYIAGIFFSIVGLVAVYYYFKLNLWKRTIAPIVLILYYLAFVTSSFVFRPDVMGAYVIRYVPAWKFGLLGVLLIIVHCARDKVWVLRVLVSIVLLIEVFNAKQLFSNKFHIQMSNSKSECAMFFGGVHGLNVKLRGSSFNLEKVQFLQEHKLSVFADDYRGEGVFNYQKLWFDRYRKAYAPAEVLSFQDFTYKNIEVADISGVSSLHDTSILKLTLSSNRANDSLNLSFVNHAGELTTLSSRLYTKGSNIFYFGLTDFKDSLRVTYPRDGIIDSITVKIM